MCTDSSGSRDSDSLLGRVAWCVAVCGTTKVSRNHCHLTARVFSGPGRRTPRASCKRRRSSWWATWCGAARAGRRRGRRGWLSWACSGRCGSCSGDTICTRSLFVLLFTSWSHVQVSTKQFLVNLIKVAYVLIQDFSYSSIPNFSQSRTLTMFLCGWIAAQIRRMWWWTYGSLFIIRSFIPCWYILHSSFVHFYLLVIYSCGFISRN